MTPFEIPDRSAVGRQIESALDVFAGNDVTEIRIFKIASSGFEEIHSGYFTDHKAAANAMQPHLGQPQTNCYFILNPINPDLLSRAFNRLQPKAKFATADTDIVRRKWLFIDFDPKRAADISATDAEKKLARPKLIGVRDWLRDEHGFPDPIIASSGNGDHLNYRVDLENDEDSKLLIQKVLKAIGAKFSSSDLEIDLKVFNASRPCKLYGTWARKGDHTESRPHRQSYIESLPNTIEIVPIKRLRAVAALAPAEDVKRGKSKRKSAKSKLSSDANRARAYIKKMPDAIQGENGSTACFNVARTLVRGFALSIDDAMPILKEYNQSCTPPWSEKELQHKLKSAEESGGELGYLLKNDQPAESLDSVTNTNQIRTFEREDRTDVANANHFVLRNSDRLKFCHSWEKWIAWDGCRWKVSDDGTPLRLAKSLCEEIFQLAMKSTIEEAPTFAAATARLPRLQAILTLAAAEMPVAVEELDQNEWLLNCINGTVDLRTGELRGHRREDMISKLCPTEFHPDAIAPTWDKFLNDVFHNDSEIVSFIRRLFGYCITGSVCEQKLPFFWGSGSNGKTTLLSAVTSAVGKDYTMQGQSAILIERNNESHPTELADLFGRRLVVLSETDSNRKLAEGTVKALTGSEPIRARRMREDFWEFNPTHKLILATNHKPVVRGTDHAIWRRLLLVPFTMKFEGAAIDKSLPKKLEQERTGILAWCVRGCVEWLQCGLQPPETVLAATASYRGQEDVIGRFFDACCERSPAYAELFKDLYKACARWCEDGGDSLPQKKVLAEWLQDAGFLKYTADGVRYRGILLKPD